MPYPRLILELPAWVKDVVTGHCGEPARPLPDVEDRMRLVIALSRRSAETGGGPFGAAVFETESHHLIVPGVNLVVPAGTSIAHAEVVALALAQRAVGSFDLAADTARTFELVTSTEPCAQCFGALPWSGIRQLVCAATTEDAEGIGFDEGPKPDRWVAALEERGIHVRRGVLRDEARAVLAAYAGGGGVIYNSGGKGESGE
jgi:tRNA(Arg) A34 adenosine deaminase TadA